MSAPGLVAIGRSSGTLAMRELLGVGASVALPWIAGALAVAALWRGRAEARGLIAIGYGYVAGALATTLFVRALSVAGWRWNVATIAGALLALAAVAAYVAEPWAIMRGGAARSAATLANLPRATRTIFLLLLVLLGIDVVALAACVAWGLLEPYDALAQWGDKAKVWYEYGSIRPFVDSTTWRRLADPAYFWDPNPSYPATVPLLEVWTTLAAGRWDESLMNMPWVAAFAALGCAFYGQVRRLGFGPAKAIASTYVLLSIPILQINVAVSGMADLFVSVGYGLAAMSLWQWTRTRDWQDAALALVMVIFCATVKNEGLVWALTLLPAVAVALHRRIGLSLCIVAAAAIVLFLVYGPDEIRIFGISMTMKFAAVGWTILEHMLVMDNWHLFWYAAIAIVLWNARWLLGARLAPMTATIAADVGFVVLVYFFSGAAFGVASENLVNRFLLQMVPALAFYLLAILREREARSAPTAAAPLAAGPAA